MNFAELADSTIYGVAKNSVLRPASKNTTMDRTNDTAAFSSGGGAPHRVIEENGGSSHKNDQNRTGTRNTGLVSHTGNLPQGGSEPMPTR